MKKSLDAFPLIITVLYNTYICNLLCTNISFFLFVEILAQYQYMKELYALGDNGGGYVYLFVCLFAQCIEYIKMESSNKLGFYLQICTVCVKPNKNTDKRGKKQWTVWIQYIPAEYIIQFINYKYTIDPTDHTNKTGTIWYIKRLITCTCKLYPSTNCCNN